MTFLQAVISGIIQGLTEFLPVSSSGHLALFQYFTGNSSEEAAIFSVVLHLGTLVAVIIAFWDTIWQLICEFFKMIRDIFQRRFNTMRLPYYQKMIVMLVVSLLPLGLTFIMKDALQSVSADNDIIIEGICFIVTGVLLYLATCSLPGRKRAGEMKTKDALTIGLMQAIAPLPGISRSGSTLSVAMILGFEKKYAVIFSFIMGIPAVFGALLLDAKNVFSESFTIPMPVLIAGLIASLIFGLIAVFMVKWLVASNKLHWFSYYTLLLGLLTVIVGIYERIEGAPIKAFISSLMG